MWNVHRIFITYIHRTLESRNTKNTYDFLVQVRNFLLPLSLKVLRHEERDTHSFYSDFSIYPPPHISCGTRLKSTGLASANKRKSILLVRCLVLNSTDFFQIPQNPPRSLPVHDVIHIPLSGIFILTSLNDTSAPRVRVNTCVHVVPK